LKRQNLSAVVGKLTAEVRYLSSKNHESRTIGQRLKLNVRGKD
jgi:hypothetical protein